MRPPVSQRLRPAASASARAVAYPDQRDAHRTDRGLTRARMDAATRPSTGTRKAFRQQAG